jgi:hypothetical protein
MPEIIEKKYKFIFHLRNKEIVETVEMDTDGYTAWRGTLTDCFKPGSPNVFILVPATENEDIETFVQRDSIDFFTIVITKKEAKKVAQALNTDGPKISSVKASGAGHGEMVREDLDVNHKTTLRQGRL